MIFINRIEDSIIILKYYLLINGYKLNRFEKEKFRFDEKKIYKIQLER